MLPGLPSNLPLVPPIPSSSSSGKHGSKEGVFLAILVGVLALLVIGFLLLVYYCIFLRYCISWRNFFSHFRRNRAPNPARTFEIEHIWISTSKGLDQSVIQMIPIHIFKSGAAVIESTDCAVCLGEFQDDEELRILPNCAHAFHLPCIDKWLLMNSNCPLCRAQISNKAPPSIGSIGMDQIHADQSPDSEQSLENESSTETPEAGPHVVIQVADFGPPKSGQSHKPVRQNSRVEDRSHFSFPSCQYDVGNSASLDLDAANIA